MVERAGGTLEVIGPRRDFEGPVGGWWTTVRLGVPVLLVAALALAACGTPSSPDGAPYTYSAPSSGTVVVSASALTGGNHREFFFSPIGNTYANSSACETVRGDSPTQPGIAFRITERDNETTAVTVSENVFGTTGYNDFNVHIWNTSQSPAFSLIGQVKLPAVPSSPQPDPLHLCAEINADVVQFVAWTAGTQPAWGDPTSGGSVSLPSNAPTDGYTGFFAGHIPAGTSATYSSLTVDGAVNNPLGCCVSTQLARSRHTAPVVRLRRSASPPAGAALGE